MDSKKQFEEYVEKSRDLFDEDKMDEALVYLKKAIRINPHKATLYFEWADYTKNFEHKSLRYAKGAAIDPNDAYFYDGWGSCLERQGKIEEAEKIYLRYAESDIKPLFGLTKKIGRFLYKVGKFDEAIRVYSKELERNPKSMVFCNNIGYILLSKGEYEDAILQFERTIEIDREYLPPYLSISTAYFQMGELDKAKNFLEKANELKKKDSDNYYLKQLNDFYQQDVALIKSFLEKATEESEKKILQKRLEGVEYIFNELTNTQNQKDLEIESEAL